MFLVYNNYINLKIYIIFMKLKLKKFNKNLLGGIFGMEKDEDLRDEDLRKRREDRHGIK